VGSNPTPSATCTSRTRDEAPVRAFSPFCSKGFAGILRPSETGRPPEIGLRTPTVSFYPPSPKSRRVQKLRIFRCLLNAGCAAVELRSAAIDANRDTRRRRSRTGWREWSRGLGGTLDGRWYLCVFSSTIQKRPGTTGANRSQSAMPQFEASKQTRAHCASKRIGR
jgi:hypothetical protein